MNKKDFFNEINSLKDVLEGDEVSRIDQKCRELSLISESTQEIWFSKLIIDSGNSPERVEFIKNLDSSVLEDKESGGFRSLVIDTYFLEKFLDKMLTTRSNESVIYPLISETKLTLESFITSYETYRRNFKKEHYYRVSFLASRLVSKIDELYSNCLLILKSSVNSSLNRQNYEEIEIYLSSVDDLKTFGTKLNDIDAIYKELCVLLNISTTDYPIIINHIESGSLWVKIAGHTVTIAILTSILNVASQHYMSEFTTTGKIQQLPITVKVIEDLFKITEKLEEKGIETKEITDLINASTRKIAHRLDSLLIDQPKIEINNKVHYIGDSYKEKLIEQTTMKLTNQNII